MKIIRNYKQKLNGNIEKIFKLLCPVKEKEWLDGWDYKMLQSESGYAEKGCIFETKNKYGSYRWVISKYDKEQFEIQFVKSNKDEVVIIDLDLNEIDLNTTECDITYTFIPVNDNVIERIIKENSEENFKKHMKVWEDSLNYYIENGKKLII